MKIQFTTSCFIFLFMLSATNYAAQTKTIRGQVIDNTNQKPIPGIMITISYGKNFRAITASDEQGLFLFDSLKVDRVLVKTKSKNYASVVVGPMLMDKLDTLTLLIKLDPEIYTMDEVVISERATKEWLMDKNFYQRQETNAGKFVDYDFIRTRKFNRMVELLRTVPGLLVSEGRDGLNLGSMRYVVGALGSSYMQLYLDGVETNTEVLTYFNPNDVAGIEYYKSSIDAPAEFGGGWRPGGVLLVWTRR